MIGIDLIENERIAGDLERLAKKILSQEEQKLLASFKSLSRRVEFVASRFAAKEAIYKALGSNQGLGYQDFSILNLANGKPIVKTKLAINIEISISHSKNYSIAICQIDK